MSEKEMVDGYLDGFKDFRKSLPEGHNYGPAYMHGWLNGLDDRTGKPREHADVLRTRAMMILR